MTMVPRVLEVIRARILGQVAHQPAWKQALFARAIAIGQRRADGARLSLADRLLDPILERLVRQAVRARFGGRLRVAISGGARLEPEIGQFFLALGIPLLQGYGQTEAGPVICANPPLHIRIDTVGPPLQGVELRIAEDGEILVRGESGDGRLLGPSGGDDGGDPRRLAAHRRYRRARSRRLSPHHRSQEGHDRAVRRRQHLAGPHRRDAAGGAGDRPGGGDWEKAAPDWQHCWFRAEGFDAAAIDAAVKAANACLSVTERIRRHAIVPAFTIENGLLTATQKVRRHLVVAAHAHLLAKLGG